MKNFFKKIPYGVKFATFFIIAFLALISSFIEYSVPNIILFLLLSVLATAQCRPNGRRHEIATILWIILTVYLLFQLFAWFGIILSLVEILLVWNLAYTRPPVATVENHSNATQPQPVEPVNVDPLAEKLEQAIADGDASLILALAQAKMAKAQDTKKSTSPSLPPLKRYGRVPLFRIPIPWLTFTVTRYGICRDSKLSLHGHDPEEWSNIKNWDSTGSWLATILGTSTFCFQSNKLGETEYRKWKYVPVEVINAISQYKPHK